MMQRPMKVQIIVEDNLRREVSRQDIFMHEVPIAGEDIVINKTLFKVRSRVWHFADAYDGGRKYGHTQTATLVIREVDLSKSLNC